MAGYFINNFILDNATIKTEDNPNETQQNKSDSSFSLPMAITIKKASINEVSFQSEESNVQTIQSIQLALKSKGNTLDISKLCLKAKPNTINLHGSIDIKPPLQ